MQTKHCSIELTVVFYIYIDTLIMTRFPFSAIMKRKFGIFILFRHVKIIIYQCQTKKFKNFTFNFKSEDRKYSCLLLRRDSTLQTRAVLNHFMWPLMWIVYSQVNICAVRVPYFYQ